MDIDELKTLLAIAQTRSFSQSATKLHVTQPAISKRIASLESKTGHILFNRHGREITLTEAGKVLILQAENILSSIDHAQKIMEALHGDIAGDLNVATSHHIGLHHLPPILKSFAKQYPQVNLKFEFLDSEQAQSRLIRNICELAMVTIGDDIDEPLKFEKLWDDELIFVCSRHHKLTARNTVNLHNLSQYPAILPSENTYTRQLIEALFKRHNISPMISMQTNYLETIKMMISVGLGWGVLPKSMLDSHIKSIKINANMVRHLGIIYHEKRQMSNAGKAFYQHIKSFNLKTAVKS